MFLSQLLLGLWANAIDEGGLGDSLINPKTVLLANLVANFDQSQFKLYKDKSVAVVQESVVTQLLLFTGHSKKN